MDILKDMLSALSSDWRNTLEEALALAAITMAWIHARNLRKQLDRLEEIRRSLPTQHLSKFPEFLDDIVKLVASARKSIVILCDHPGYGVFSNPDAFLAYSHALEERANKGKSIEFACLDAPLRRAKADQQFPNGEEWQEWLTNGANVERADHLLTRYSRTTDPKQVGRDEIIDLLGKEDERVLADTFAAPAQVSLLKVAVPLYFWLIDGNRAIFAIPGFHEPAIEHGYSTQDPHLIEGLLEIRDRYLSASLTAGKHESSAA